MYGISSYVCMYIYEHDNNYIYMRRLGTSIVIKAGRILPFFTKNLYNPFCFIQYYNRNIPPMDWKEVCTGSC